MNENNSISAYFTTPDGRTIEWEMQNFDVGLDNADPSDFLIGNPFLVNDVSMVDEEIENDLNYIEQGDDPEHRYEELVNSENPAIQVALAKQGYGWDVLRDKSVDVKLYLISQGYSLNHFKSSFDPTVIAAVVKQTREFDDEIYKKWKDNPVVADAFIKQDVHVEDYLEHSNWRMRCKAIELGGERVKDLGAGGTVPERIEKAKLNLFNDVYTDPEAEKVPEVQQAAVRASMEKGALGSLKVLRLAMKNDPVVCAELARQGKMSFIFSNNKSPLVRLEVAKLGLYPEKFAKDPDPAVRLEVAKRGEKLDKLIYDTDARVLIEVARQGGEDELKVLESHSDERVRLAVARRYEQRGDLSALRAMSIGETSTAILEVCAKYDPVLNEKLTSRREAEKLYNDAVKARQQEIDASQIGDDGIRYYVEAFDNIEKGKNIAEYAKSNDPVILRALAEVYPSEELLSSEDPEVKAILASKKLFLGELINDREPSVALSILKVLPESDLPEQSKEELLNRLCRDVTTEPVVLEQIAKIGGDEQLTILRDSKYASVRAAVAERGREEDLNVLVKDDNYKVQVQVALNGNKEQWKQLSKSDNPEVRAACITMGYKTHRAINDVPLVQAELAKRGEYVEMLKKSDSPLVQAALIANGYISDTLRENLDNLSPMVKIALIKQNEYAEQFAFDNNPAVRREAFKVVDTDTLNKVIDAFDKNRETLLAAATYGDNTVYAKCVEKAVMNGAAFLADITPELRNIDPKQFDEAIAKIDDSLRSLASEYTRNINDDRKEALLEIAKTGRASDVLMSIKDKDILTEVAKTCGKDELIEMAKTPNIPASVRYEIIQRGESESLKQLALTETDAKNLVAIMQNVSYLRGDAAFMAEKSSSPIAITIQNSFLSRYLEGNLPEDAASALLSFESGRQALMEHGSPKMLKQLLSYADTNEQLEIVSKTNNAAVLTAAVAEGNPAVLMEVAGKTDDISVLGSIANYVHDNGSDLSVYEDASQEVKSRLFGDIAPANFAAAIIEKILDNPALVSDSPAEVVTYFMNDGLNKIIADCEPALYDKLASTIAKIGDDRLLRAVADKIYDTDISQDSKQATIMHAVENARDDACLTALVERGDSVAQYAVLDRLLGDKMPDEYGIGELNNHRQVWVALSKCSDPHIKETVLQVTQSSAEMNRAAADLTINVVSTGYRAPDFLTNANRDIINAANRGIDAQLQNYNDVSMRQEEGWEKIKTVINDLRSKDASQKQAASPEKPNTKTTQAEYNSR